MKKILIFFFILSFVFISGSFAMTDEESFERAQAIYSELERFSETATSDYLFITGAGLKKNYAGIIRFCEKNFEFDVRKHIVIDLKRGDGFVDENGKLALMNRFSPDYLYLHNFSEDIGVVGPYFLKFTSLRAVHLYFPKVRILEKEFMKGTQYLDTLTLDLPELERCEDICAAGDQHMKWTQGEVGRGNFTEVKINFHMPRLTKCGAVLSRWYGLKPVFFGNGHIPSIMLNAIIVATQAQSNLG